MGLSLTILLRPHIFSDGLFVMCACLGVFASCAARSRCREDGIERKGFIRGNTARRVGLPEYPWVSVGRRLNRPFTAENLVFSQVSFQVFAAADVLAADEYLRCSRFACNRAHGSSGRIFAQNDFFVNQAFVLQGFFWLLALELGSPVW